MNGSYGSAITHVQSGIKILCEVECKEESVRHQYGVLGASTIPYASVETLEEMFVRLDLQVTQVRPSRLHKLRVLTTVDGDWAWLGDVRPSRKTHEETRTPIYIRESIEVPRIARISVASGFCLHRR
jgi:hypothetical protein